MKAKNQLVIYSCLACAVLIQPILRAQIGIPADTYPLHVVLDDGAGNTSLQLQPSVTSNTVGAGHRSAEPNQCNVQTLRIRCFDQTFSPVSCSISLQLTADTIDVGGHVQANHSVAHPLGNIVASTDGALPPDPNNCPAVGSINNQYSFTTPVGSGADQGTAMLLYYAPEASGSVAISGTAFASDGSGSIGPASIHVQVSGLQALNAIPGVLQLTGPTAPHPVNHYGQASFIATLSDIASIYDIDIRQKYALPYPFAANDESLIEGGIFDLDGAYNPASGHHLHRFGISADVGSGLGVPFQTAVPPSVRTKLNHLVQTFGLWVVPEGSVTHWHLEQN